MSDAAALALIAAGALALDAYIRQTAPATGAGQGSAGGGLSYLPSDPATVSTAVDTVARTIWGEARGEGERGMQAVANVIANRVARPSWWGSDWVSVCRKPYQFSAWNSFDANHRKVQSVTASDPSFRAALDIAARAVAGTLPDITGGATHYHARSVSPSWAGSLTSLGDIGAHRFYS